MKKLAVISALMLLGSNAHAACSTHTYYINGKMVICTTCCVGEGPTKSCNTTCN